MSNERFESLFSYGTLQKESVQLATFGRKLDGEADALLGYRETVFEVQNPNFAAASGTRFHRSVEHTGSEADVVSGVVFQIALEELEKADAYEAEAGYGRVRVRLKSGNAAWLYVGLL